MIQIQLNNMSYQLNKSKCAFSISKYARFARCETTHAWTLYTEGMPSPDSLVIQHDVSADGVDNIMISVVRSEHGHKTTIYSSEHETIEDIRGEDDELADLIEYVEPSVHSFDVQIESRGINYSLRVYAAAVAKNHMVLVGINRDLTKFCSEEIDHFAEEAIGQVDTMAEFCVF